MYKHTIHYIYVYIYMYVKKKSHLGWKDQWKFEKRKLYVFQHEVC